MLTRLTLGIENTGIKKYEFPDYNSFLFHLLWSNDQFQFAPQHRTLYVRAAYKSTISLSLTLFLALFIRL